MTEYWPCAIRLTDEGKEEQVSTYDSCFLLEQARHQIELWKSWYKYNIVSGWIDIYEKSVKQRTLHVDPNTSAIICTEIHPKEKQTCGTCTPET